MALLAFQQSSKVFGFPWSIIYPFYQAVFERKAPPGLDKILMAGIQHFRQLVGFRDGHQVFPYPVIWRMEGQGKGYGKAFLGQAPDPWYNPAC